MGNLSILSRSSNSSVGIDYHKKAKEYDKVLYAFTPSLSTPWSDERIDERSDELITILCKAIDIDR
ncbi:MAG: GmrSD restriction endonuclease domain-containing protein [Brevinema sp.]